MIKTEVEKHKKKKSMHMCRKNKMHDSSAKSSIKDKRQCGLKYINDI